MPDIYDLAQQFKAQLLARERKSAVRLVEAYGTAWNRLKKDLDKLTVQIKEARARGEAVNQAWLYRQQRYFALLRQVTDEIAKFADLAERQITKEQRAAVNAARKDSERLLLAGMESAPEGVTGSFDRLSAPAVESLAGFLSDGSPLRALLDELPRQAGRKVAEGLTNAVVLGWNPRKTARNIREALGGNLTRALRISRTETLRAYREASHRSYNDNQDILEGWVWLSALNARTCAACIALHGTFHLVTERLQGHIQCRCTQIPSVKNAPAQIERGADWFAKQPAQTQRTILETNEAYEAYKSGRLKLEDFVGRRDDPRWGSSYHVLSTKRALAGEERFPGSARRPIPVPIERPPLPVPAFTQLSADEARKKILPLDKQLRKEVFKAEDEFLRLNRQWQRTGDEAVRIQAGDARQRVQDLKKARRDALLDVLSQDTEADFNVAPGAQPDNTIEGITAFRRLIGNQWLKGEQVRVVIEKPGTRAKYDLANGIHISKSDDVKTVVHELGHWLEDKEKTIFGKITDFLDRRTKNDQIQPLRNYSPSYRANEQTKPDKFLSPYMGKQYYTLTARRTASEILSMGLEYFYDDPAELAKEDPEYFDFLYDLVRGR